jgi:hypothetical protein
VEESSSSSLLNLADSVVLVGVDVHAVSLAVGLSQEAADKDPIAAARPHKGVSYRIQFSVLKDMLVSSGEEREHGGRR